MFSQFARTWHYISVLENFPFNFPFSHEFPPENCGAKLATVTNKPVDRPPPISSDQKHFLLKLLKLLTVIDMVQIFKSGTIP